ncbi:MAG: gliding motility protein GldN [Chitinophagaceae bacterium]|nr:gliding motility protein GldN [Chitinophagaceae bacterium]
MKKQLIQFLLLVTCLGVFDNVAEAQQKKRKLTKRNTTKKTTQARANTTITPTDIQVDAIASDAITSAPAVNDSLPLKVVKKSLRRDEAVETNDLKDRTPLPYEHLRADDAVFRHKIWREIDTREKINLPFRYAASENNGDQRFISILLQAIQDSAVTVFSNVDDRFTTPMTKSEVGTVISGDEIDVPIIDSLGVVTGTRKMRNDINLDSFYKFRIKEEVIFDKESSRLFWRILGIAPVKNVITSMGVDLGENELFWVYYPDMRPIFTKYEVYNGKNFGARMSWDELFESRMFYGRIIKSTMDNPYDLPIKDYKGLSDNKILQLLEGENIKEKIFNYEQDLWSY